MEKIAKYSHLVGNWCENTNMKDIMVFVTGIGKNYEPKFVQDLNAFGYGINALGEWVETTWGVEDLVEATNEEVKIALVKMAIRKGYDLNSTEFEDLRVSCVKCNVDSDIFNWHYNMYEDALYTNKSGSGGRVVYKSGKWAKIKCQ